MFKEFFEKVDPKPNIDYAFVSYIKGLTEPLKRILNWHSCHLKTSSTLQQMFHSVKDRPSQLVEDRTNVAHKISFTDGS